MIKPLLAELIRPKTVKDFIGQSHLLGENKPIKLAIDKKRIHSMIFWGPPGCGKTTLASLLVQHTKANFYRLSAVSAGKADIKKIIQGAQSSNLNTILFLDEIHRFNKAQQDFLLPYVDTSLYYLARMVNAGEDPLFIARRMVIFASEDIGMAVPTALVVANEVFQACQQIGYPECQINLAHGATYLATCKKDRSAYNAYFKALNDVKKHGNLPIPLNLRNAPTKLMKKLEYGKGYQMYTKDSLLPKKLKNKKYYLKSNL